jgi:hypothetical protein
MVDQWWIARGKQKAGPHSSAELRELARTGGLLPIDMVLLEGTQQWRRASEVEGLFWVPVASAPEPQVPALPPALPERVEGSGSSSPLGPNTPPVAQTSAEQEREPERAAAPEPPDQPAVPSAMTPASSNGIENAVQTLPWEIDFGDVGGETPTTPTGSLPAPPATEDLTTPVLSSPPAAGPPATAQAPAQPAGTSPCGSASHDAAGPPSPGTPAPLSAGETQARQEGVENPLKTPKEIKAGNKLVKRLVATACLAGLLGLVGDFMQPLAPVNFIAFAATSVLALVLAVLWVKKREALGRSVGLTSAVLGCLAAGFGGWWALAYFHGGRDKGYLAAHFRLVSRVQSAVLSRVEGEELAGAWGLRSDDPAETPACELRFRDGKMTWRFPKGGSTARIEAEYGTTKDHIVYGIITIVDSGATGAKAKEALPEEGDTFCFRFRVEDGLLTVKEVKGKGLEELKAQYRRTGE